MLRFSVIAMRILASALTPEMVGERAASCTKHPDGSTVPGQGES